jgi:hypothetical protein
MTNNLKTVGLLLAAVTLASCGGGGGGSSTTPVAAPAGSTQSAEPKALTGIQAFKVMGTVYDEGAVASARVTAYGTTGTACGNATTDDKGVYEISGSCKFPVVIAADVPDANDTSGAGGEGRKLFATIPAIMTKDESFDANLSGASTAVTLLAIGKTPEPGTATPASVLTADRQTKAVAKVKEVVDAIAAKMGYTQVDLLKGSTEVGEPLGDLLTMSPVSFERIESTKQTIVRFHVATEHRPVALVYTDGKGVDEAFVDTGLGTSTQAIDEQALRAGLATVTAMKQDMAGGGWVVEGMLDSCYLHNGGTSASDLIYLPNVGQSTAAAASRQRVTSLGMAGQGVIENVKVLRLNTYVDQDNETLEKRNDGEATLAYVSFDYKNHMGLKERGYTWVIKGTQIVNGCLSSGDGGWRILGNQRIASAKVRTYAVHQTLYSQAFGSRTDKYGTGVESLVVSPTGEPRYTHFLISGPGIPGDGAVYVWIDGGFLYSTNTLLSIRLLATKPNTLDQEVLDQISGKVQETKSVLFETDKAVREVTDAYYDRQNTYTIRLFKNYADLYPTLTYQEIIPKRPYLVSELRPEYFHSVGVNIDRLVQSLQTAEPVDVNWSLPTDKRGVVMKPRAAWITRLNCVEAKKWPNCAIRSDQFNEWSVAPEFFTDFGRGGTTINPWAIPFAGMLTFKGVMRVELVDSLNRPLETSVGVDYKR